MGLFSSVTDVLGGDVVSKTNPLLGLLSEGSATGQGADIVASGGDTAIGGIGYGLDKLLTDDAVGYDLTRRGAGGGVSALSNVYDQMRNKYSQAASGQGDLVELYADEVQQANDYRAPIHERVERIVVSNPLFTQWR